MDVKGAFLLAPRKETRRTLITRPPQIVLQAGLCGPKERWWVKGAMYGLDSSPADWAAFRDASLKNFNWHDGGAQYSLTSTSESNLWSVVEKRNDKSGKVVGHVVVYVDDMMVCGPDSVVQGCLDRIAREWSCSQPEWVWVEKWIKFCGFELRWGERGLLLGQPSYIGELAHRHGVQQPRPVPFSKPEVPEGVDVNADDLAQGLVGELLWLSVRTRPDISFGVAWMAQHITKCPQLVVKAAEEMVGYLLGTQSLGLSYERCVGSPFRRCRWLCGLMEMPRNLAAALAREVKREDHCQMRCEGRVLRGWFIWETLSRSRRGTPSWRSASTRARPTFRLPANTQTSFAGR